MSASDEMRRKTVCFTGHRQMREPISEVEHRLTETVENFIQSGYLYFIAGGARGFDALASEVVLKLKITYPQIHLLLVLPFDAQYSHERNWTRAEIEQYHRLKEQASKVVVLAAGYTSGIYYSRNRHLVNNSSVCVAYMTRANSGTSYTVNYAKTRGLEVVNTAVPTKNVEKSYKTKNTTQRR